MYGKILRRILGGTLVAGFVAILAGTPSSALGQKKKDKPAPVVEKAVPTSRITSGPKSTAEQLARRIDAAILAGLKAEKTAASPLCTDEEFVRRVYLDLSGKIPTADQAVKFLDAKESNKRAKLIDELLASKEFGKHQSDIWATLLLPVNSDNRFFVQYYPNLKKWLEEQFDANTPWDKMVKTLMTASGAVDQAGPAIYWAANTTPDKMTDNVTRMFLGVQLQCAQCHNHPFTDYKRNEYWETAAFFMKVKPEGNPKALAKNGGAIKVGESNRPRNKKMGLPDSAKLLPPKFLGGDKPTVKAADPLRPVFADWLTSPKNAYFGRAMTNRVWGQLFGRGFINPVDDMHDGNANSHPQLLAAIEYQFIASGFDLKYLYRAICNSDTYQRTSKPTGNNLDADPSLFARMAIKPLTGEQMFDSLTSLAGPANAKAAAARKGAGPARFARSPRDAFVTFFAAEDGANPTDYHTGIPQVLRLMNSPQLNNPGAFAGVVRSGKSQAEIVEKLYLTALARRPTAEEIDRVNAFLRQNKDARQGYAGLMWALLNSSEFALNR